MSPKRIPALTIVACVIGSQQYLPAQDRKLLARIEALEKQVAEQNTRLQNLADIEKINKLTRAYGYYVDKNLWDQVVDTDDQHVLVVRAIENSDVPTRRNSLMNTPQVIVRQLQARWRLKRMHVAALWIYT